MLNVLHDLEVAFLAATTFCAGGVIDVCCRCACQYDDKHFSSVNTLRFKWVHSARKRGYSHERMGVAHVIGRLCCPPLFSVHTPTSIVRFMVIHCKANSTGSLISALVIGCTMSFIALFFHMQKWCTCARAWSTFIHACSCTRMKLKSKCWWLDLCCFYIGLFASRRHIHASAFI